ncbi:BrnA antitoxin family protein [Pollutimonas sp. M17]|uniref:BrnA antitoxin family protein n=1 Tax=Pollutimonas sp. M17 TaxID=2962065 RepID=UPI0021F463A4|nr:BrnA antitoxin family protein [Pollutimonas sp. M17]UYO93942.1 BrnA antitoxin family protein [Pollutimonas sp. M17]
MPKLKSGHISPTPVENAKINDAISTDPDTREMTDEDFAHATVGAARHGEGKTRITIWVDCSTVAAFKSRAAEQGKGYQTLMNETLRAAASKDGGALTEDVLRRILREELHQV